MNYNLCGSIILKSKPNIYVRLLDIRNGCKEQEAGRRISWTRNPPGRRGPPHPVGDCVREPSQWQVPFVKYS